MTDDLSQLLPVGADGDSACGSEQVRRRAEQLVQVIKFKRGGNFSASSR
jgi:hypothetical protein